MKRQDLSENFRNERMKIFLSFVDNIQKPIKLLDVGGTVGFWQHGIPEGFTLTLINIFDQEPMENVNVKVGDACDLTQFESNSFDIVFSNSVLGHVGNWERQKQLATEIRRVGKYYFVQTPNQNFPLDWRTLVPFFHWLSPPMQAWCFQRFQVGRYKKVDDADIALELATRVRNVTASELNQLFPDSKIIPENIFGFTKSFMAHNMAEAR